MKALITGASSGIGKEMALYLSQIGYDLYLVGRNEDALKEVSFRCNNAKYYIYDLSDTSNAYKLYDELKNVKIDLLVNNAGFGLFGYFNKTDLNRELEMINVNIVSLHILSKLFLKDMVKRNRGKILNVASSAGFFAGPYLSTYYATKNYVLKLTMAISEELKRQNSKVTVSALCPGPVDTGFNKVAGGHFNTSSLTSKYVARVAIDNTLKGKLIIVPSLKMKLGVFFSRFLPYKLQLKILYKIQKGKTK